MTCSVKHVRSVKHEHEIDACHWAVVITQQDSHKTNFIEGSELHVHGCLPEATAATCRESPLEAEVCILI